MTTGRKYIVVMAIVWALILVWGGYWLMESRRMTTTLAEMDEEMIALGAQIYAENCVVCHGPLGEGVVGPALNRENLKGDPHEDRDTFDFIYNTVYNGRPGSTVTQWKKLPNGAWASFTAMPTWGRDKGGPLNEQQVRAVTSFIMAGDFGRVSQLIPQPSAERLAAALPNAVGLTDEENAAAQQLFRNKGCIACHTIGQAGGFVGPDLTRVGSWGVDIEFLRQWVSNPPGTANRAPTYWSNYGGQLVGEIGPDVQLPAPVPLGPTTMPKLPFTEEELDLLTRYLMGLK